MLFTSTDRSVQRDSVSCTVVNTLGLAILLSFLTGRVHSSEQSEVNAVNVSSILNQFMEGYDKRVRPNYGGIPVTVGVSLYILSIGDLSEKFMDFTFDMYFRQFWHDPRKHILVRNDRVH